MSGDHRDQRGGHPPAGRSGLCRGCPYCATDGWTVARREKRAVIDSEVIELNADNPYEISQLYSEHAYLAGRCLRCNLQELDESETCRSCPGDPVTYTTETPSV